jgi:hypothetical protein
LRPVGISDIADIIEGQAKVSKTAFRDAMVCQGDHLHDLDAEVEKTVRDGYSATRS